MAETQNPAYALRSILQAVLGSNAQTVLQGWETVLHAGSSSLEFAERHSEVVGIYSRLHERLLALPGDVDGKAQYMGLLPRWYEAVVYREGPWGNSGSPATRIGDPVAISQLTGLGALFELHLVISPRPTDDAISKLRASLDEWDSILDSAGLDEKLANELRASVRRLRFLLEDDILRTFGTEPVLDASANLVGTAIRAMGRTPGALAKRIGAALGVVVVFLHGAHQAVDDTNGFLEGVIQMTTHVSELMHPTKELEPPKPLELPQGADSEYQSGVIDAETVDDNSPDESEDGALPER